MDTAFPDFRNLSVPERIQLAEDLWDSVARESGAAPGLTAAQVKVVKDRIAAYRAEPDAAIPWAEVRGALYSRSR